MPRFLVRATCDNCGYEYSNYSGRYWFPRGITGVGDSFPFPNPPCLCPPNTEYILKEYQDINPDIPYGESTVADLLPKEPWAQ